MNYFFKITDTPGNDPFGLQSELQLEQISTYNCCILCFDLNEPSSFKQMILYKEKFINLLQKQNNESFNFILLGTKSDLKKKNSDLESEIAQFLKNNTNIYYLSTSSKENLNIEESFQILAKMAISCNHNLMKINYNVVPKEFLFLSEHCQLCFLTTSHDNFPDIHIMFFTYHSDDNVVILTTKKDKKYQDITENPNVSVLLHSFEGRASTQCSFQNEKPTSATIYAKAYFSNKEKDIEYRESQVKAHPKWGDAFRGDDKVVIVIPVEKLLIVDVLGKVIRWEK